MVQYKIEVFTMFQVQTNQNGERKSAMRDAYIICMIIGFSLLILSVLGEFLEGLSGAFEAVLNMDLDFDLDLAFLPISGVSLCTGLITFGGLGLLFYNPWIAGVSAYIAAMIVQTIIRRLKKVDHEAMNRDELFLCDGKIINTVLPGGLGTVEFDNIKGSSTTFACRAMSKEEMLKQNTVVELVDFEEEIALVRRKDTFTEYQG